MHHVEMRFLNDVYTENLSMAAEQLLLWQSPNVESMRSRQLQAQKWKILFSSDL